MALTPTQQIVKTYVTQNPDAILYEYIGFTKGLDEWFAQNDTNGDEAVSQILNSQSIGAAKAKSVSRATIDGNDMVDAIGASDEFATMQPATLAQLTFLLSRSSLNATPKALAALGKVLGPFDTAKVAFEALKKRPASIYESLTEMDGAAIPRPEVNALHGV